MNRTFRILWSRARSDYVVVSEAQSAQTSGSVTVDDRPAEAPARRRTPAFALLPVALAVALACGAGTAAAAVTAAAGGPTTVTTNGSVHNVTTNKVVNGTGVNRFSHFDLERGHIANLQLGDASRLLNFVDEKISIDGTVNAVKNSAIGGDLYFVSAKGMVIGATGVVNAGRLTAVVPTNEAYLKWRDKTDEALNDGLIAKLDEAEVPLNPNGVITVNGSIHAGNRVMLAATQIEVKQGAKIETGVKNFGDLVNIKDAAGGAVTSAGLTQANAVLQTDPDSGDVILLARADTANQQWAAPLVTPMSVKASVKVEKGAEVKAARDAKLIAAAGSGDYLEGSRTDGRGTTFTGVRDGLLVDARAEVALDGAVTAGRDVVADAYAWNRIYDTGLQNMVKDWALGKAAGLSVPIAVDAAYYKGVSGASVYVGKDASVTAARDVKMKADSSAIVTAGTSTKLSDLAEKPAGGLLPAAAVVVGEAESNASVVVDGTVTSGGSVSLESKNLSRAKLSATEGGLTGEGIGAAVVYGDVRGSAITRVGETGRIKMNGTGDLTLRADQTNNVINAASVLNGTKGTGGAAFNLTRVKTSADASFLGSLEGKPRNITIASKNLTEHYKVRAEASAGHDLLGQAYQQAKGKIIDAAVESLFFQFMNEAGSLSSVGATDWKLGAAAAVSLFEAGASTTVAPKTQMNSTGDISITSEARRTGAFLSAVANQKVGLGTPGTEQGTGSLALVVEAPHTREGDVIRSLLKIADGAHITAGGKLALASTAANDSERFEALRRDLQIARDFLKDQFAKYLPNAWEAMAQRFDEIDGMFAAASAGSNTIENTEAFGRAVAGLANGVAALYDVIKLTQDTPGLALDVANATIDFANPALYLNVYAAAGGATVSGANGTNSGAGSFAVLSERVSSTLDVGRNTNLYAIKDLSITGNVRGNLIGAAGLLDSVGGVPVPKVGSGNNALGASLFVLHEKTSNAVRLFEGASVTSLEGVDIAAETSAQTVALALSAGAASGGSSLSGMGVVGVLEGDNTLSIDDEAKLYAVDDIDLSAKRRDEATSAAGGVMASFGQSGSTAGAGIAVNTGSLGNTLSVADNDAAAGGSLYTFAPGIMNAGGSLRASAKSEEGVRAVGAAGYLATPSVGVGSGFSGALNAISAGFGKAGGFLEGLAVGPLTNIGSALSKSFSGENGLSSVFSQLAGSGAAQNGAGLTQSGAGALAAPGSGGPASTGGAQGNSAGSVSLAGAGSGAWNNLDLKDQLLINAPGMNVRAGAGKVELTASVEKAVGAYAGSAAVNLGTGKTGAGAVTGGAGSAAGKTAAVAGALAGNSGRHEVAAEVKGLVFRDDTGSVEISALSDGTVVAEGLGIAAAKGESGTGGVAGDVAGSVNILSTATAVRTEANSFTAKKAGVSWSQTAWSGDHQITGGSGAGLSVGGSGGGASVAGGFTAAVAKSANSIESVFNNNTLKNLAAVDAAALSSIAQTTTAVTANAAAGSGTAVGLSGAVAYADLTNVVASSSKDSTVEFASGGRWSSRAQSADAKTAETLAQRAKAEGALEAAAEEGAADALFADVALPGEDGRTLGALVSGAQTRQVTVAVGAAGSAGANAAGGGAGAGIVVNNVTNSAKTSSQGLVIKNAGDASFAASADARTVGVAAGVSAGRATAGAAGSVLVGNVRQDASVEVAKLTSEAARLALSADSTALTAGAAGSLGAALSGGSSGAGMGAAVLVQQVTSDVRTADSGINHTGTGAGSSFSSHAENNAEVLGIAAGGVVAKDAALGGSVAVNRVTRNTTAHSDAAHIAQTGAVEVSAQDRARITTAAGAVAGAVGKSGAGLAGAVAYSGDFGETRASASGMTLQSSAGTGVRVAAEGAETLETIAAAAGGGGVGFAGGAATNDARRTVAAEADAVKTAAGERLGGVEIDARGALTAKTRAGFGAVGGLASIGAHASVNRTALDVGSVLKGADFNADTLAVTSSHKNAVDAVAAGASGAAAGGVLGSVSTVNLTGSNKAEIIGSRVDAAQKVLVKAGTEAAAEQTIAGAAVGGTAALGAVTALSEDRIDTRAAIEDSSIAQTGDKAPGDAQPGVEVAAGSKTTITTRLGAAALSGGAAAKGVANVLIHGGSTEAALKGSVVAAVGDVKTHAADVLDAGLTLVGAGASAGVALDAVVSKALTDHRTTASVTDEAGGRTGAVSSRVGSVFTQAAAAEKIALEAVSVGAAGAAAASGVVSVLDQRSDVSARLSGISVEAAREVRTAASYQGSAAIGAWSFTGAAKAAAGGAVEKNTADNTVEALVEGVKAVQKSGEFNVNATRSIDWTMRAGAGAAGLAAASGLIALNEIGGATRAALTNSTVGTQDQRPEAVSVLAANTDKIRLDAGGAGVGFATLGGSIILNRIHGAASADVTGGAVNAAAVTLNAEQNRFISAESVFGSAGAFAGSVSVLATYIGAQGDPFTDKEADEAGLGAFDLSTSAGKAYAEAQAAFAAKSPAEGRLNDVLTDAERGRADAAFAAPAATETAGETAAPGATRVTLSKTAISTEVLQAQAAEDAAEGAGVKLTAGNGAAAGVGASAGVVRLHQTRGAAVSVIDSTVVAKSSGSLEALAGGVNTLSSIQGAAGIGTGQAGYAEAVLDGTTAVTASGSRFESAGAALKATDRSKTDVKSFGVAAAGLAAGGMYAGITDGSNVRAAGSGLTFNGSGSLSALRDASLSAESTAGAGGVVTGVGALANLKESGTTEAVLSGSTATGDLAVDARNAADLFAHAYGANAAGLSAGVSMTDVLADGRVRAELTGTKATGGSVRASAATGAPDGETARDVRAWSEAYGGAVALGFNYNKAVATEATAVETVVDVQDGSFGAGTALKVLADAHSAVTADAGAGAGGALHTGADWAQAVNRGTAAVRLAGPAAAITSLGAVEAQSISRNALTAVAKSAGGGAVVAEGTIAARARILDEGSATTTVSGGWSAAENFDVKSAAGGKVRLKVENVKGGAVAGTGAEGSIVSVGKSTVEVKDGSVLEAGALRMRADALYDFASTDGGLAVDSGAYGAAAGTGAVLDNRHERSALVSIGRAHLLGRSELSADAFTKGVGSLEVRGRTAGAVAGVTAKSAHTIKVENRVTTANGSKLSTSDWTVRLRLSASADEKLVLNALSQVEGAGAAGAGAEAILNQSRTNAVSVASGSTLSSRGYVDLWSGRSAAGEARFDLETLSSASSRSAVTGADAKLTNAMSFSDRVDVAGTVESGRDVSISAKKGYVRTVEEARTYTWLTIGDASDKTISSSILGTMSKNLKEESVAAVGGSVTAGRWSGVDVSIEGGVYSPDTPNLTPKVEAGTAEEAEAIRKQLAFGSETEGNHLWNRHQELTKILAEFPADGNATERLALIAEDKALVESMLQKGFVKRVNGVLVPSADRKTITFKVGGITVSGGNIAIDAEQLEGSGSLNANRAKGINILNRTNADLLIGDLTVLDAGGRISLNGGDLASAPAANRQGWKGTSAAGTPGAEPTIRVDSHFWATLIEGAGLSDEPGVRVLGAVRNNAGGVTIDSEGDVHAAATGSITSAGSITLKTDEGSITQSYRKGVTNIGQAVESQYHDEIEQALGSAGFGSAADNNIFAGTGSTAGSWVAGGDIFIAGETINVNGTIQSGYGSYELNLNEGTLAEGVKRATAAWEAAGRPESFDVRSDAYLISDGRAYEGADGVWVKRIRAWFDPSKGRVVIDDVSPKGGRVTLAGGIASTGGGRIFAADGSANINVNAGDWSVLAGNITSGNREGKVVITDTYFAGDGGRSNVAAKVTEITSKSSSSHFVDQMGNEIAGTRTTGGTLAAYNPAEGLNYVIDRGWRETTTTETLDTIWGIFWGLPTGSSSNSGSTTNRVPDGAWSATGRFEKGDAMNNAFTASFERNTQTGQWDISTQKSCGFLCFNYTITTTGKKTDVTNIHGRLTVKADQAVGVKFLSGADNIQITSKGDLTLGGRINSGGGTVKLVSTGGAVQSAVAGNAVSGAGKLYIQAAKGVGTKASAFGMQTSWLDIDSGGDVFASVTGGSANKAIWMERVKAAGSRVEIAADQSIQVLDADVGSIDVRSQLGSVSLQVHASGDASGRRTIDAQAAGDVFIRDQQGDIVLGAVKAGGSASIQADQGSIHAAPSAEGVNKDALASTLALWSRAGIFSEAGSGWKADDLKYALAGSLEGGSLVATRPADPRIEASSVTLKAKNQVGQTSSYKAVSITKDTAEGRALLERLAEAQSFRISADPSGGYAVDMSTPLVVKTSGEVKVESAVQAVDVRK